MKYKMALTIISAVLALVGAELTLLCILAGESALQIISNIMLTLSCGCNFCSLYQSL